MDKRTYYQQKDVVDRYDAWRFGSPGGRHVDRLEKRTLMGLLEGRERSGRILDMPCGTGRLLAALREEGFTDLVGADTSPAMLGKASQACPEARLHEADAFATPFGDASFRVVCSMRFLFHVPDVDPLFREVARILEPGGHFVFDTLRWTPRGFLPLVDRNLGGRLSCHSEAQVAERLQAHGLRAVACVRVMALPSLCYRFLPGFLVRPVVALERWAPRWLLTKSFVLAVKEAAERPGA